MDPAPPTLQHRTLHTRLAGDVVDGREVRRSVPRRTHAELVLAPGRDPVALIEEQNRTRVPELVPVRNLRLLASAFTFYRGTAAQMAQDLAAGTRTGIDVVACGDAHLSNFGLYASPERNLVFDLNDFDEGAPGPWEWDLKRLATSAVLAAQDNGLDARRARNAARACVVGYRGHLRRLLAMGPLERYYADVRATSVLDLAHSTDRRMLSRSIAKARRRTAQRFLDKVGVETVDGRPRIIDQPPLLRHVELRTPDSLADLVSRYRDSVSTDVAVLLDRFEVVDFVQRVVGVRCVGTRCFLVLLQDPEGGRILLQVKEALDSVLHSHGGIPRLADDPAFPGGRQDGRRVVTSQRVLQAHSDRLLGWIRARTEDGSGVDLYWRQFRDMKGAIEVSELGGGQLARYSALCGSVLARAHAQSPTAHLVSEYLGSSGGFADAVAEWAVAYARQCTADHAAAVAAAAGGRLPVAEEE